ncbi:LysE family translocator [Microvirga roseola]|uniref:LysE family translocator n=1 Tax=Microvirga roseola TaxID=2883126 RepID=UPI001E37B25D|nr:LysE family translocator [Microvirga roseola]
MTVAQSLLAFLFAAAVLTITPGLDTALVLRTSALEGARKAAFAGIGITLGCLVWGLAVAVGLAALLTASELAFTVLKWAGAAYLVWLGARMILKPREGFDPSATGISPKAQGGTEWLWRGLLTNLLNPKAGIFYISFLPQFVPAGVQAGSFILLLVMVHVVLSLLWFAALILATRPLNRALRRPAVIRVMDRLAGCVFVGFGVKLALARR